MTAWKPSDPPIQVIRVFPGSYSIVRSASEPSFDKHLPLAANRSIFGVDAHAALMNNNGCRQDIACELTVFADQGSGRMFIDLDKGHLLSPVRLSNSAFSAVLAMVFFGLMNRVPARSHTGLARWISVPETEGFIVGFAARSK